MAISGNVPQHLVVGARTGFLNAVKATVMPWQRVAGTMQMGAKSVDLVDLGAAPMPTEEAAPLQDFIEKTLTVKARNWKIRVGLSYNAIADDQTASLERKVRAAGENFQKHINDVVFKALNAGDATTYGSCYDGLEFFDASHKDKGAAYTTVQSNVNALALSLTNFNTVMVAARNFVDDQGNYVEHDYNLLVVPPALEYTAAQICTNDMNYANANNERNPYSGVVSYITTPQFTSSAWVLLATGEASKPLYVAMREQPGLQDSWFDPDGPDGGMYYFQFYARYNVFYGDWRLADMGNT